MCGIAGIWSPDPGAPPRTAEVEAMVASLRHRGPDGQGVVLDGQVGLGHARLSIIDLAGGAQPMSNADGTVWITFNGEIFNYIELRQQLIRAGNRFRTESDTEVLIQLYEEHGDDFVDHLNGQFALALWDGRRGRLVLARDRVGIRPLFYAWARGRLAFASEVKALFALPEIPRRFDSDALASLFSFWAVLPPHSVFEGILALPAGTLMSVDAAGVRMRRYWDWPYGADSATAPERVLAEELHDLLEDAVRLQLRADVPVGAYLSGGLDSSIVTTIVKHQATAPLRSFSIGFEDRELDERAQQQELVTHLRAEHSSLLVTGADIGSAFPRAVWHAESPVVRTAPAPMMLLADSVRAAGYKVVLTGEGADEAFGGYDLFKEAKIRRFAARQPASRWRGSLFARLYPYLTRSPAVASQLTQRFFMEGAGRIDEPHYAHMTRLAVSRRIFQYFAPEWRERLLGWSPEHSLREQLPQGFARWKPLERDQYVESITLMNGYLLSSQGDRMAMAASVEARYPFLDHRVLEFACRLPPRLKIRGLREKVLLREAFAGELPPAILNRSKQPYRAPDVASFFVDEKPLPYVQELLSPRRLKAAGIFEPEAVAKLVEKCRGGRAMGFGDSISFVGILSTMLVHQQYIEPAGSLRSLFRS